MLTFWPILAMFDLFLSTYFYQCQFAKANVGSINLFPFDGLETKIVKHFPDKEEVGSLDVTCYKHLTSLCSLINRMQKCVLNLWKPLGLAAFVAVVFYFHKVTNKEEEMKVALGVGRR